MNREQLKQLEKDLWAAADKLRANSDLKASEYSTLSFRETGKALALANSEHFAFR